MIKIIGRMLRGLIIGAVWTYIFLIIANIILVLVWHFNMFSAKSWQHIVFFWNHGGTIKHFQDYLFLFILFSFPVIWLLSWIRLLKVDYSDILFTPVHIYNRFIIRKYGSDSKRIILRNIKPSRKIKDVLQEKLDKIKPDTDKEVDNIRQEVREKISSRSNH